MTDLEDLEEGDKILFNDRKQPLEVVKVEEDRVLVEGPGGGEYEIYEDDGTLLWSKEGNRRYSSYCKDLRTVGTWEQENNTWEHTSGTSIKLEKNEIGYWTIKSEGIKVEEELDLPKYGYSDKEKAEKDVQKVVRKYPEG
jgi:hypothetical protein